MMCRCNGCCEKVDNLQIKGEEDTAGCWCSAPQYRISLRSKSTRDHLILGLKPKAIHESSWIQ